MADKFSVDGDAVRGLAQLLTETQLSEIEYQVGTHRIRVSRNGGGAVVAVPQAAAPAPVAAAPAAEVAPAPQPAARGEEVTSPMVGTAYLQAEPGTPPFVKPGDTVSEGDTLLIVEAMKVMNPIKAPRAGKVLDVLVNDSTPVEYGEPLIILE